MEFMNKYALRYHLTVFLGVISLIVCMLSGCKKSNSGSAVINYENVKFYDDKKADPRSNSIFMAAAPNRLFMSYAQGFDPLTYLPLKIATMVTDDDGNLIHRDSIPSGYTIGKILNLDDGTFAVLGYQVFSLANILIHFDHNGKKVSSDSIQFPISFGITGLSYISMERSVNGNLLIFGYDLYNRGFYGEYNVEGNEIWSKQSSMAFLDCMITRDDEYLFAGFLQSTDFTLDIRIMKSNSLGDTLWTRKFYLLNQNFFPSNMNLLISGSNNINLVFPQYEDIPGQFIARTNLTAYTINQSGDSLSQMKLDINNQTIGSVVQTKSGGFFALLNEPLNTGLVFNQINTRFLQIDASSRIEKFTSFQTIKTDYINAACFTSEGKLACFGLSQSMGNSYYSPALIFLN